MYLRLRFEIFWQKEISTKAPRKMLVKLTTGWVYQLNVYAKLTKQYQIAFANESLMPFSEIPWEQTRTNCES